ncbi:hypothetical protein B0G80_8146 [Paraburkholderia sp. BL6669N2]|nr:hypothetical protein B0G80_8146 [Paraburkholderia sp. BL6669N2]
MRARRVCEYAREARRISDSVGLALSDCAPNLAVQFLATDVGRRLIALDGTMHHCTTLFKHFRATLATQ